MWDQIKALEALSPSGQTNLWKLISHLVATKALSLAVLKVRPCPNVLSIPLAPHCLGGGIYWAWQSWDQICEESSQISSIQLLVWANQVGWCVALLWVSWLCPRSIFSHLSTQPNLKQLKEQIIIFIKCFLQSDEDKVVTERIRMVEEGLRTNS